jgi:hypothetical protein
MCLDYVLECFPESARVQFHSTKRHRGVNDRSQARTGCGVLLPSVRSLTLTRQLPCPIEDGEKHGAGKLTGIGVLQGWMIAGDDIETAGQHVFGSVGEDETDARRDLAGPLRPAQQAIERDAAQADGDPQVASSLSLHPATERSCAAPQSVGLLAGGAQRTTALIQRSLSFMPSSRLTALGCEAKPASYGDGVEKVARSIAGEDAPGAVRTVRAGRQPQGQNPCLRVAKRGYGPAPVFPLRIGAAAHTSHLSAMRSQTGATVARDDAGIQGVKGFGGRGHSGIL